MEPEKGIFIKKSDLPELYWDSFQRIADLNQFTIKELICKMIVQEVNEIQKLREPLLGQIVEKMGNLLEKKMVASKISRNFRNR